MVKKSKHRGYEIIEYEGVFYFADTGEELAFSNRFDVCGECGEPNTPEGHDACLGTIPGPVMNACCGHGETHCAYIQFNDGTRISGHAVFDYLKTPIKENL